MLRLPAHGLVKPELRIDPSAIPAKREPSLPPHDPQMTSFGDGYILSSGRDGHKRLRVLCKIHDPLTRGVLLAAGLHRGAAFADFPVDWGTSLARSQRAVSASSALT